MLLTRIPLPNERDGVFAEVLVEGMLRFVVLNCLDEDRELVVEGRDLAEVGCCGRVLGKGKGFGAERVVDGELDVVDG